MTKTNIVPSVKINPTKASRPAKSSKSNTTLSLIMKKLSAGSKSNQPDPLLREEPQTTEEPFVFISGGLFISRNWEGGGEEIRWYGGITSAQPGGRGWGKSENEEYEWVEENKVVKVAARESEPVILDKLLKHAYLVSSNWRSRMTRHLGTPKTWLTTAWSRSWWGSSIALRPPAKHSMLSQRCCKTTVLLNGNFCWTLYLSWRRASVM